MIKNKNFLINFLVTLCLFIALVVQSSVVQQFLENLFKEYTIIIIIVINLIITIAFVVVTSIKIKNVLSYLKFHITTIDSIKGKLEENDTKINTIGCDVKEIRDNLLDDNVKDGLDTAIESSIDKKQKELIENIKELITGSAASLREALNNSKDAPNRKPPNHNQLANNRFKEFYLDVYKKGFKENFGEIIYVCQVFENDEKKARFKITNLEGSMKSYFFNNGDLNNSLICKRLNHVDREKSIKTKALGILKRKDDGTWEPDTPVEIEFI